LTNGEIIGFLGANGAGKSTTIKILTGYLAPTSGKVLIDGLNIENHSHELKKIVGYLPESNPLYFEMYVYDLLKFIASTHNIVGVDFKESLDRVIAQCGLSGVMHKTVGECSKGYKQRVGLACV
jgi:ABC-2 type transport system ATP-binding protein